MQRLNSEQPPTGVMVIALERSHGADKEGSLAVAQPWLRCEERGGRWSAQGKMATNPVPSRHHSGFGLPKPDPAHLSDVYAEAQRGDAISLRP